MLRRQTKEEESRKGGAGGADAFLCSHANSCFTEGMRICSPSPNERWCTTRWARMTSARILPHDPEEDILIMRPLKSMVFCCSLMFLAPLAATAQDHHHGVVTPFVGILQHGVVEGCTDGEDIQGLKTQAFNIA